MTMPIIQEHCTIRWVHDCIFYQSTIIRVTRYINLSDVIDGMDIRPWQTPRASRDLTWNPCYTDLMERLAESSSEFLVAVAAALSEYESRGRFVEPVSDVEKTLTAAEASDIAELKAGHASSTTSVCQDNEHVMTISPIVREQITMKLKIRGGEWRSYTSSACAVLLLNADVWKRVRARKFQYLTSTRGVTDIRLTQEGNPKTGVSGKEIQRIAIPIGSRIRVFAQYDKHERVVALFVGFD
jgi:hypothetical protein